MSAVNRPGRGRFHAASAIVLLGSFLSCAGPQQPMPTPAPLRLAAASDLQSALPKLADRFRSLTGISSSITFGASGQLAEQIKQGAPFDVFLSANESFVRKLAEEGIVNAESVKPYARGSLVLAIHKSQQATLKSLTDLTKPSVKKIAIANPATAPYGKAAKQAIERADLWTKLESKIVIAESVRQALLYAQKGDAEAALVGRAIADVPEIVAFDIDASLYDPIIQALGVIAASRSRSDADKFAQWILSDDGQRLLRDFGFRPPPANEPKQGVAPAAEPSQSKGPKL